ncbi:MAG: DUF72 domain-containing protein [Desulfurococcales archaeon]|nr:DUF72 domain-containing protein [Desulfurococcales archaeon]
MEVYVGTSGWLYDWNEGLDLDWYIRYSGLNAVELNASFYRFPFPNQVKSWARKSSRTGLRWAVKVHRSITHYRRLTERALEIFERFRRVMSPLEEAGLLDFYLFQMPPNFTRKQANLERVEAFLKGSGLDPWRMALELRHKSWFNKETVEWASGLGMTLVSIDAPIATWIVSSNGIVYLRMHGRSDWYAHDYTIEELGEVVAEIKGLNPRKVYVFFNNDHWMLGNARTMLKLLQEKANE